MVPRELFPYMLHCIRKVLDQPPLHKPHSSHDIQDHPGSCSCPVSQHEQQSDESSMWADHYQYTDLTDYIL